MWIERSDTLIHALGYNTTLFAGQSEGWYVLILVPKKLEDLETFNAVLQRGAGDRACAEHPIFRAFKDPAMVSPGEDAKWAVGTEPRQPTLHTPEMRDPHLFREILVDDVRRRHYVLDAVVEEQTYDLMTIGPTTNEDGEVVAEEWGGMRRIDKLLFRW